MIIGTKVFTVIGKIVFIAIRKKTYTAITKKTKIIFTVLLIMRFKTSKTTTYTKSGT